MSDAVLKNVEIDSPSSDLAQKFERLANTLVDRAEEFIDKDKTTLSMVATAAAIATDRALLLRGKATAITGTDIGTAEAIISRVAASVLKEMPDADPAMVHRIAREEFERMEAQKAG